MPLTLKNFYALVPLNPISDLTVVWWDTEATITWTDPVDLTSTTWTATKLVRKVGSAPTSISDWTLVLTETTRNTYSVTWYTDTWLTNGTTYYYAAFAIADNWLVTISSTTPSVTPEQGWWQPWANTIAYYKLDWDGDDYSGNSYDMTTWATSYETLSSWIKVGRFDSSAAAGVPWNVHYNYWLDIMWDNTNPFTYSFFTRVQTFWDAQTYIMYSEWQGSYRTTWINLYSNKAEIGLWYGAWSNYAFKDFSTTVSTDTWYHFVFTYNYNSWSPYVKCYQNWILLDTISTNAWTNWNTAVSKSWIWYPNDGMNNNQVIDLSEFIIEDKERTSQEISDYFDQTKSLYWIS